MFPMYAWLSDFSNLGNTWSSVPYFSVVCLWWASSGPVSRPFRTGGDSGEGTQAWPLTANELGCVIR